MEGSYSYCKSVCVKCRERFVGPDWCVPLLETDASTPKRQIKFYLPFYEPSLSSLSVPLALFCQVLAEEEQTLVFTIPIFEPLPSQYYVRGVSDRWLGSEVVCALSFKHLILPEKHPPHTELLDLQPLPITALKCKDYELLYR